MRRRTRPHLGRDDARLSRHPPDSRRSGRAFAVAGRCRAGADHRNRPGIVRLSHDARRGARRAGARPCARCPRQGPRSPPHRPAPCRAERAHSHHHRLRAASWLAAGWHGAGRVRLQLAGALGLSRQRRGGARLSRGRRHRPRHLDPLRHPQPGRRSDLRPPRSACAPRMTDRRAVRSLLLPGAIVGTIILAAAAAPMLALPDPIKMEVAARLTPPVSGHFLGRDEYGRDVLSRLLWGARASLAVAFLTAAIAGLAGTFLGLLGGYFRGLVELLTVRSAGAVLCFPPMLLALLVVTLMGPGAGTLVVALAILYAPGYARVAYAETLAARALDYVAAQEAVGALPGRILAP